MRLPWGKSSNKLEQRIVDSLLLTCKLKKNSTNKYMQVHVVLNKICRIPEK